MKNEVNFLDRTGREILKAIKGLNNAAIHVDAAANRVEALDSDTVLGGINVIDVTGIPAYLESFNNYADYDLTEAGWYVFVRITAKGENVVTENTTVSGAAGYIATEGNDYIDVAIRFDVAAQSQVVRIDWDAYTDVYVFKATDLAIRNLDYRTTFYVYDAAPYVTWEYTAAADATFVGTAYYTLENGVYTQAAVKAYEAVTANTYYTHAYALTSDETFVDGKKYYTLNDTTYTEATVTAGEAVTANTYYEDVYTLTTDKAFVGTKYYTQSGETYTQAAVKAGEAVTADTYYTHSKCIISGMVRNVTYRLDEIIDCPMEFILPEIEDETHGCWFEIRCRHAGSYSMTLTPPEGVTIATEHTQAETEGINMIDLHYTAIDGLKVWRFMNTHSSLPTT